MPANSVPKAAPLPRRKVETFSILHSVMKGAGETRLDASFYNPRLAEVLAKLNRNGMKLSTLGDVTERIFIPPRFKRIYVEQDHGVPFLQGSHVVHFQPADIKYLSRTAHTGLERWIIDEGWVLVTCSGTIGRVAISPPSWKDWAASQHILRIVPKTNGPCPVGYLCAFLSSPYGQAQLTSRIYGAVVDEITEEQAASVLIPVPKTAAEKRLVEEIHEAAMESVRAKEIAVSAAQLSVANVDKLLKR